MTDLQDSRDFADSLTADIERQHRDIEVAAWVIAVPIVCGVFYGAFWLVRWAL